jgi:hypothetical protein
MKKNTILILIFTLFVNGCNCQSNSNDEIKEENSLMSDNTKQQVPFKKGDSKFIPDTTVNKLLLLSNDSSILVNIGNTDNLLLLANEYEPPHIYFINKLKNQFLKMDIQQGSFKNCFGRFSIGYLSLLPKNIDVNLCNFESFFSESGIKLGMTIMDVIQIKGDFFSSVSLNEKYRLIFYSISEYIDFDWNFTSMFLERYNMPAYIACYWFENNKLIKFEYGFEYP